MAERITVETITMTKNGRGFQGAGAQKIAEALATLGEELEPGSVLTIQEDGTAAWSAAATVTTVELDLDTLAAAVAEKLREQTGPDTGFVPEEDTTAPEPDSSTPEVDSTTAADDTVAAETPAKASRASKAAAAAPSADTK